MSEAQAPAPVAVGTAYAQAPAPEAAAPAAAPAAPVAAAPAAPAPTPAPAIPEPKGDGTLELTGDPGLDTALEFVNNAGIKANDPAIEAARNGDFTLLEAKLAALGSKAQGYERMIALARQAYERHSEAVSDKNAEVQKVVHQVMGGEAEWQAVQAWAGKEATPAEKEQINAAFAAGGIQARAAAQYLAEAYKRAGRPGYREPAGAVKPDAGAGAATAAQPMTAKAYAAEVQKLLSTSKGRDITNSAAYQQLQQQRLQAKRAGY